MKIKFVYTLYCIIVFALACTVPYFFSVDEPSQSLSYMVGFNNKVGFLLLFICALPLFFHSYKSNLIIKWLKSDVSWSKSDKKFVAIIIGISALLLLIEGFLLCGDHFTGSGGEGSYIMHYVYAVEAGADLYGDIHYIYGPLTVYPIVWLSKLGFSINASYFFILFLYHVLGLILLYDLLLLFDLDQKERKALFLVAAIIFYPLATGLNFCSLRFVMLPWALYYFIKKISSNSIVKASLFLILSLLFIVLYSQEYGLCYVVLISLYAICDCLCKKRPLSIIYVVESLIVIVFLLIVLPNYFTSIIQAGSGGGSYPFIPSMIILLVVIVFLIYGLIIGGQVRTLSKQYPLLVLEFSFIIAFPSALGRCDPPHILYNLFFAIVISYVVLIKMFNSKHIVPIFILSFLTFFPYHILAVARSVVSDVVYNRISFVENALDKYNYKWEALNKLHVKESEYGILKEVNGTVTSIDCDNQAYLVLHNSDYKETFYGHKPRWIGNKNGFDKELDDLKRINVDYLVLPNNYKASWMENAELRGNNIDVLFCTYYRPTIKFSYNQFLYGELIDYIEENYNPIVRNTSFVVFKRKE